MSYSLVCLWFWIRFIAVPFYLTLSRVGEAENPGPVCATAKLFGANYDAIGLWAQNLSNRSEVELEPLFAQVGECRQMFSERFGKDSKLYTSSVSQDIHSTHSHLDRSSLLFPLNVTKTLHTLNNFVIISLFFKKVSRVAVVIMFCRICIFVAWKARSGVTLLSSRDQRRTQTHWEETQAGAFQRCGEYSPMQRDYLE